MTATALTRDFTPWTATANMVSLLAEIEQFYREQDQRMGISDGDSDDDAFVAGRAGSAR